MQPDIRVVEEILAVDYSRSGPITNVEGVGIPEPLDVASTRSLKQFTKARTGPKSNKEWVMEMRRAWRNIDDEYRLEERWLAGLPQVQRLAASKYGGLSVGKGLAVQELLRKAISDAQNYATDKRTHEVLLKYPQVGMTEIADQFGLSREHFSRICSAKATTLVIRAFQHLLTKPTKETLRTSS